MSVTFINRYRSTYYLHVGTTRTGKPKYWFSMKSEGDLADSIPEGYEVYENPDAQVFLRKKLPQVITPEEVAVVRDGLGRLAPDQDCMVDLRKEQIIVYHSERISFPSKWRLLNSDSSSIPSRYLKILRFTLINREARTFKAERWCFRGSIDDWIDLRMGGGVGKLSDLVERYCRHVGRDSFFELM